MRSEDVVGLRKEPARMNAKIDRLLMEVEDTPSAVVGARGIDNKRMTVR